MGVLIRQGCHTHDIGIGLRKLMVLTLNIHQIFNCALVFPFLIPIFSPKAYIYIYIYNVKSTT